MDISYTNNTKKYMILLLSLFKDLKVAIDDTNSYEISIKLASASRLYKKLAVKSDKLNYRLPLFGFEFVDFEKDTARIINRMNKRKVVKLDDGTKVRVYQSGVAYNFNYRLTMLTKTSEDLTNISEYIISLFHNGVRYLDYNTIFDDTVSTAIRLVGHNNDSNLNENDYNNDTLHQMTFDFSIEGFIETNTPYDDTYIQEINLILQKAGENVDYELESYIVE